MKVKHGCEVALDYELRIEGEDDKVIDKSEQGQPLKYTQGSGQIIYGLECQVSDMDEGEEKEVKVKPEQAYGLVDPKNIMNVPINEIPENIPKHVGADLILKSPEGQEYRGIVTGATDEEIQVDFNHPLAGKTLNFKIKILEVKEK